MSIANRSMFLLKTAALSIATGFKSWDKAENQNILYAHRLNEDYGSDRTQIFYLNWRGWDCAKRCTANEPLVSTTFYGLRGHLSAKWNPLSKDTEESILSKGIELYMVPPFLYCNPRHCHRLGPIPRALHNIQISHTRLKFSARMIEI